MGQRVRGFLIACITGGRKPEGGIKGDGMKRGQPRKRLNGRARDGPSKEVLTGE